MPGFFAASRVLIVAGKGGVGKTTLGAIIGVAAADAGLDTLAVEISGLADSQAVGLGPLLGVETLDFSPRRVRPGLEAMRIDAEDTLAEYLAGHGLERLSRRLLGRGTLEVLTTAAPGIKDLLILGKLRQMTDTDRAELIVVDAPASGHALSLLRAPEGFVRSAETGPVHEQARLARAFLGDAERCQVCLVTVAEETPISETVETAFALEEDLGVSLGPVLVNQMWPTDRALARALADASAPRSQRARLRRRAAEFRLGLAESQAEQLERLGFELPVPQVHVPYRPPMGSGDVEALAAEIDWSLP